METPCGSLARFGRPIWEMQGTTSAPITMVKELLSNCFINLKMIRFLGIGILAFVALNFQLDKVFADETVELEVQNLQVPSFVRSGESIKIVGTVVNRGSNPVLNLKLGVAVAGADGPQKGWEVLEKDPQGVIAKLNPGDQIIFSSKVRLGGDGLFQIGIVGTADNASLSPQAKTVRVIDSSTFALQTMLVLFFYLLLLGIGAGSLWYICRPEENGKLLNPSVFQLGLGVTLATLGPPLLFFTMNLYIDAPLWGSNLFTLAMMSIFGGGWLLTGSALRPQKSWRRGIFGAIILYVVLGIIWVALFNAGFSRGETPIIQTSDPFSLFLLVIAWPLQVAQFFGLFGLGFG